MSRVGGINEWVLRLVRPTVSNRLLEDQRILGLVRSSYDASGGVYGAPRILLDLRELGVFCGQKRVARLMRTHGIRAVRGYKAPRTIRGRPSIICSNRLDRQFTVEHPNQAWVTDITYIRTWQGWLYLAIVVDLFSRKVVGWSMKPSLGREVVLDAVMMAVWRRSVLRSESIEHANLPGRMCSTISKCSTIEFVVIAI